jgi:hypothetical protein
MSRSCSAHGEKINVCRTRVGKPEGKRTLGIILKWSLKNCVGACSGFIRSQYGLVADPCRNCKTSFQLNEKLQTASCGGVSVQDCQQIPYILESNPHLVFVTFLNEKNYYALLIRTFPSTAPCLFE